MQKIELGLADEERAEVLSGLASSDLVVRRVSNWRESIDRERSKNPFLPQFKRDQKRENGDRTKSGR